MRETAETSAICLTKRKLRSILILRAFPTGFHANELIGKIFIATGTGKYFKNVTDDPENDLGIIHIAKDGTTAESLWGMLRIYGVDYRKDFLIL